MARSRTFFAATILSLAVVVSPHAALAPEGADAGQRAFGYWCATCHAPGRFENGRELPGTASLANKYKGARPAALEDRTDLTADYVRYVIRNGTEGMPFFRPTEISKADAEAIGRYLARNNR
jgi:mono/diheme cytochrome c family protein